jgi:hypothetical protein
MMMVPPMIALLQAASEGRRDMRLSDFDETQVQWAVVTGLGALLCYTTKFDAGAALSPLWPLLQTAYLTAQMLSGTQLDAMAEIIDACAGRTPPLTLLKGISICEQYYPQPYLRPMRDLDFLVEEANRPGVESLLFELGYRQQSNAPPEAYERRHHTMPFYHPQKGVWVEVHRRLFSPKRSVAADKVFGLDHLKGQLQASEFHGRPVYRLSSEFQIVYISAHWGSNLTTVGGMIAMLDLIYLLRYAKEQIRWDLILHWLHGSVASLSLYFMLTYLQKYQLVNIPPEFLKKLFSSQQHLRGLKLKILQTITDRYLVEGKDFGPLCTLENLDAVWQTLLAPGTPIRGLIVVLRHVLHLRARLYRLKSKLERGRSLIARPARTPMASPSLNSRLSDSARRRPGLPGGHAL